MVDNIGEKEHQATTLRDNWYVIHTCGKISLFN
jgi:hypothetical protein